MPDVKGYSFKSAAEKMGGMDMPMESKMEEKVHYPSLYLDVSAHKGLDQDVESEVQFVVRGVIVSKTVDENRKSVTIEIREIGSPAAAPADDNDNEATKARKKLEAM